MLRSAYLLACVAGFCATGLASPVSADENDRGDRAVKTAVVWFTPRSSIPVWNVSRPDFIKLFEPDAPWPVAASHVQVFKLYSQFVSTSILNGGSTDADLKKAIDALNERHIAIGLEAGLLRDPNLCGKIEGYCGETITVNAARIKRLGGDLRYVAMDEPLWFGHVSSEPGALHTPIADLARNVAVQAAALRQIFPDVEVGDIEPVVGSGAPADYIAEIESWADAFNAATGRPLAFFHSDVGWQGSGWQQQLTRLSHLTRKRGIAFGIIYNGNPADSTGVAWTTDAEKHFVAIEADPAMIPDHAIIQTWDAQPDHALPETQPGTMTYLVDRYAASETAIDVRRTASGFEGRLASRERPVGGASLSAYEVDDGTLNITWTPSLTGTVPQGAVAALFGLRVNIECNCDGPANLMLGAVRYLDETSSASEVLNLVPPSQRLIVPATQTKLVNSPSFPVTPGDSFSFSAPMKLPYSSRNTGYVAIIFLGTNGLEVQRMELPFQPGQRGIGSFVTDSRGRFEVAMPGSAKPPAIARFTFPGSRLYRLSSLFSCDTDASAQAGSSPDRPHDEAR